MVPPELQHFELSKLLSVGDALQAGGAVYTVSNDEVRAGEVDRLAQTLLQTVTNVSGASFAFHADDCSSFCSACTAVYSYNRAQA